MFVLLSVRTIEGRLLVWALLVGIVILLDDPFLHVFLLCTTLFLHLNHPGIELLVSKVKS